MTRPADPARRANPGRRADPARSTDPARGAALEVLRAVAERDAYANLELSRVLRRRRLAGRDAAFATELVAGTLRRQGTYDAVLATLVNRPLARVDPALLAALRMGCHQLLVLRTPAHAGVGATVDVVRHGLGAGPSRLANAVLRRVAGRGLTDWLAEVAPAPDQDPVGHLAVTASHPRWVVDRLRAALGGDLDETAALLRAHNEPAGVSLLARPRRASVAELIAAGASPGRWSPYAATLPAGDPGRLPAVQQRRAAVQDEGSQLVAIALTRAEAAGSDRRWLDACAGPGGKATLLAGLAAERGASVLVGDVRPHRAAMVRDALAGALGWTGAVIADATRPAWRSASFDRVLVDAPCTGMGALRRRPEARWRRSPADLPGLTELQRRLLGAGLDAVRTGGVVGYATCSPLREETAEIVAAARRQRGDTEVVDATELLPEVTDLGPGPYLQLWPHRHGTDAMFLAVLRRTG